ncbi:DNA-processing protein DprA [Defluviimonas sp. WL0024]|uniref:DNA-processing protein DprA n=1 Tax=Albidovulum salinarum TaxID=2984153 RepID=A0ABT2WZX2_9RHOB|nr:DNA-processing protein DprA [Defluviimonas sp. WL0024]MCU9847228.1 DNA-processing protein DprA [Defluviimonas sp. WL0024]
MLSYPTPFTPPTKEDDRLSWLRLIRSRRVGAVTFWRLIGEYGSAEAALHALPGIAKAAGVQGYEPCPEPVILKEYQAGTAAGARLLCRHDPAYPRALAELADAPPVLWCLGDPALLSRPMVALVGARNASSLGLRMARKLAEGLGAAGVTVVSGLARGVDTAAHAAALPTGTVAVMAGGVDVTYPAENAALASEIALRGLRLSEQPIGLEPQARHFPLRNRIISGLARAVVVVEAAARSGSLITARLALDQGRDVLAVPGHPFDGRAAGCNLLLRDGATLVRGAEDVLAALAPLAAAPERTERTAPEPEPQRTWRDMATLHRQILDRLGPSPVAEDQLIRDLALPSATIAPELLALELEGRIQRQPGGLLSRLD